MCGNYQEYKQEFMLLVQKTKAQKTNTKLGFHKDCIIPFETMLCYKRQ
jgi:hypothetical protein